MLDWLDDEWPGMASSAESAAVPPGLATVVRRWRGSSGLTQHQLADISGLSVGVLRDIEQGRVLRPRRDSLERLMAALSLDAVARAELMGAARPPAGPADRRRLDVAPAPPAQLPVRGTAVLGILGPLVLRRDGRLDGVGGAQQRAVLGLLAAQPNSAVHREAIIDALWGEYPPESAVAMVQTYVSRLRGVLARTDAGRPADQLLVTDGACYLLRVSADELDLLAFAAAASRARDAAGAGNFGEACSLFEEALGLWRGDPLVNVDVLRQHPLVSDIAAQRAAAVADFARAAFGASAHERVLPHLAAQVGRDPLDERAHAALMVALASTGQQAAAFDVFTSLRQRLDDQLGVRPSEEVTEALAMIARRGRWAV